MQKVEVLTSADQDSVFIVDDSMIERNRSKAVELLARCKDHATGTFYKGVRMLTLGWSDSHTFVPMDFAMLHSSTSAINGMNETLHYEAGLRQVDLLPYYYPGVPDICDGPIRRIDAPN